MLLFWEADVMVDGWAETSKAEAKGYEGTGWGMDVVPPIELALSRAGSKGITSARGSVPLEAWGVTRIRSDWKT